MFLKLFKKIAVRAFFGLKHSPIAPRFKSDKAQFVFLILRKHNDYLSFFGAMMALDETTNCKYLRNIWTLPLTSLIAEILQSRNPFYFILFYCILLYFI